MKPATHTTFAERTGRMLARLWSGFVRLDRKACGWLVAQGLPAGLAKTILWRVCRILCKRTIHRRRKPACP